ncbi:MAG: hypothetical protein U0U66_12980 [Cytophagaceae bacterium]
MNICLWTLSGCKQNIEEKSLNDSIYKTDIYKVIEESLTTNKIRTLQKDSISAEFTNAFLLPPIKSVKYVFAQTSIERMYFEHTLHFNDSLAKFLKLYNRKLSDFGKYKIYYTYVFCSKDSSSECICNHYTDYNGLSYGLLIFYDPISQMANITIGSYNFSSESEHYEMLFTIESNNTIILYEQGQTEGEGGEPEDLEGRKHIIKLSKEGLIQIYGDE